jgi:hypothetical protein
MEGENGVKFCSLGELALSCGCARCLETIHERANVQRLIVVQISRFTVRAFGLRQLTHYGVDNCSDKSSTSTEKKRGNDIELAGKDKLDKISDAFPLPFL